MTGPAAADNAKETAVRAAFLFRLAFFVSWPEQAFEDPHSAITLCLTPGNDGLARTLSEQTARRTVNERPVSVRELPAGNGIGGCHIVYGDPAAVDTATPGHALVVVGERAGLLAGGALALEREELMGETRLVFYARRDRLQDGRFSISSKLLQLVRFDEAPR